MDFTTKVSLSKATHPINYDSKVVLWGSCFAENMGEKFQYFKFQTTVNPFGIIFNPVSIAMLVARAINQESFTEADVFQHNDLWHCFEVHSDLSHPDKEVLLANLNQLLKSTHHQITASSHFIITYGTAWVYRLKASGKVVANCHKVPQANFDKEILSVPTIEKAIADTIARVQKVNPNIHFIFTVSPVRHLKDGFLENQRSKAHLITAIHNSQFTTHNYFPSYEIMMDELRDYRFYGADMLHPNQVAIDYIWERFLLSQIDEAAYPLMQEVDSIQKGLAHRPFHPDSKSHLAFLASLNQKITALQSKIPHLQF